MKVQLLARLMATDGSGLRGLERITACNLPRPQACNEPARPLFR